AGPQDPEDYVAGIGRTARAGASGKAISLVDEASAFSLEAVERFIGQRIRVEWAEDALFLPEIKPTAEERRRFAEAREARRAAHGGRGPRPGGPPRRPPGRAFDGPRRHAAAPPPAETAGPGAPGPDGRAGRPRRRRRRSRRGNAPGAPAAPPGA